MKTTQDLNLEAELWNQRIAQIDTPNVAEFRAYLEINPYKPALNLTDISAYNKTTTLAEKRIAPLGDFGKIAGHIIKRELQFYDEAMIEARAGTIQQIQTKSHIGFDDLPNLTQDFIFPKLQVRTNEVNIRWIDGNIVATYPPLALLDAKIEIIKLNIQTKASPTDTIIKSYLSALKILIIHPFLDGNGRISRLIATAALMTALNLEYVPFLEPFIRARGNHISATIQSYLETGNATPFLFAFSGAVRDGLELREG